MLFYNTLVINLYDPSRAPELLGAVKDSQDQNALGLAEEVGRALLDTDC